jgi:gliding motility-associated lipoprotein GldJ
MLKIRLLFLLLAFTGIAVLTSSCVSNQNSKSNRSRTTGWAYNNPQNGGFEVPKNFQMPPAPGLIPVQGGTFVMGLTPDDPFYQWDNTPRRVTVGNFYMDETEVSNLDYQEYIYWLTRVYGENYPNVVQNALPDTLVWIDRLSYNEPMVEAYFRHPAFNDYPVVGVSWIQANDYAKWRTDRVNEQTLINAGILDYDIDQKDDYNFNTEAYLAGQYEGIVKEGKEDLNPNGKGIRNVRYEDGILYPSYRLPTEAEWEYAAYALIGNTSGDRVSERRLYPWDGQTVRSNYEGYKGKYMANFKIGEGNYSGVTKDLNDGFNTPAPVRSYWPNDFGLYNMAGNVSEWTLDVYRPLSHYDVSDMNPFRGNVLKVPKRDMEGHIAPKDSLGRIQYVDIPESEVAKRPNIKRANNVNYKDGDYSSNVEISGDWTAGPETNNTTNMMYNYGQTTLINDKSRVIKGGSWKDGPYFLSPGVRRFMDEDQASATVGFRCAMDGTPDMITNYNNK